MNISVEELTSVDKEITIKANREDLSPKFNQAFKKYQKQIQMPGFRPGNVPIGLVKKRFGREIEMEEINSYVQEVYEKEIVPEYEPVGETQMVDMKWEDDQLEVTFKVGAKPSFELTDLSKVKVDKMVHDVSDEEVEEEIERTLDKQGNWAETDGEITEESRVTVDAVTLDAEGNPVEGETDEDQKLDLRQEGAKEFRENLIGKKAGDVVNMELGEGDDADRFELHVKKVEEMQKAELTDEFAKEQSQGQAANVDEFRSYIKSSMQEYYDQSANDMFRNDVVNELTEAHDFEIPDVMEEQILESYVEYAKQQSGGQLPEDFNFDEYKERMRDSAVREGKWAFISEKLQEKFDDIEIKPEDIDEFIAVEAARYGATADQLKSYYAQNPSQLENLRNSIRENKVFDKLNEVVTINELPKEEFREKREKKEEKQEKAK
ncbi:trigger factor [Rhodohalobacter mucosus]|uniref:Trigger factor n=1 Tax=Rhodohalobacter mucosus TaxID=2079485 RepID=A0A316TZ71_9BACT|nr:trigger factor [Rhodohalobacter mucosus]PWN08214.1 trigger factor [Rhodohalobacter mucosus]